MLDLLSYLSFSVIIASGLAGIFLAGYIRYKKIKHQVLVCPLNSNCEAVTHSEFSTFLGIPVELLGIAYYLLITISYTLFLFVPSLATINVVFASVIISTGAFLFSLYLTFIQAFSLKQWCTWCLMSASLCTIIFITALLGTEYHFIDQLAQNRRGILAIHMVGLALGLGGATIADIFFFKFLKDFRISHEEAAILQTLSQVIWAGLAVLILSGIGLYLPQMEILNASSKFLAKMVVVGVIIVNGSILNLVISPKLVHISFGQAHEHQAGELHHLRRVAYALGAVSATSWWSAFILGMLRSVPLTLGQLLWLYGVLIAGAILGSQILDRFISRRPISP
ncbi:MAG: vitamin K epoxide reductase family protein [Candidatus Andersenbacteria bacterium]